jgi:hypothetical protein
MVDIERLEPTSAAFAQQLLRTQPWLRSHARVEDLPGRDEGFLVLSVPSPSPRPGVLTVDTGETGRISVSWGRFSAEFDAPPDAGRSSQLDAALDLVEDVLADRVALYVLTREGRWAESGTVYDERDEQELCRKLAPGVHIELFSWEGTRDDVLRGDDFARGQA